MIINSVFIRLASLSETAIADIVSFYGTEALNTCILAKSIAIFLQLLIWRLKAIFSPTLMRK